MSMPVNYTALHRTLATVGLTSLLSLCVYSFSSLAETPTLETQKTQFSRQQDARLKCGYMKKEITLKVPVSLLSAKKPEGEGYRVEPDLSLRCGNYRPPIPLTALIPQSNIGITSTEYPTFYFYIPDANLEGVKGELVLRNEKDKEIYKKTVPLKATDSIISFDLSNSPSLPPLEVGKSYYWVFTILFDEFDRSSNSDVAGWIKRVEPNSELKQQLNTVLPHRKPAIYAANGIWYEALSSLAKLRCSSPNDATLVSDWKSLLQQVELPEISIKPLAQCNQLEPLQGRK
jgi:hypothetical protein